METPIFQADCSPSLLLSTQEEDDCPASRRLDLTCQRDWAWFPVHFILTPPMDLSWIDSVQNVLSPFPFFWGWEALHDSQNSSPTSADLFPEGRQG